MITRKLHVFLLYSSNQNLIFMKQEKIFICPICGKIFDNSISKKPKLSLHHHIKFCNWRKELLDKEELDRNNLKDYSYPINDIVNQIESLLDE